MTDEDQKAALKAIYEMLESIYQLHFLEKEETGVDGYYFKRMLTELQNVIGKEVVK